MPLVGLPSTCPRGEGVRRQLRSSARRGRRPPPVPGRPARHRRQRHAACRQSCSSARPGRPCRRPASQAGAHPIGLRSRGARTDRCPSSPASSSWHRSGEPDSALPSPAPLSATRRRPGPSPTRRPTCRRPGSGADSPASWTHGGGSSEDPSRDVRSYRRTPGSRSTADRDGPSAAASMPPEVPRAARAAAHGTSLTAQFSQPTPSRSESKLWGSGASTRNRRCGMSPQSRSGGGGAMQTSG